jgi:hypothetical protein
LAWLAASGSPALAGAEDGFVAQRTPPFFQFSRQSMTFIVAKGSPEVCGSGCDKWIAAEGDFDVETPRKLRKLLDDLGERRLPVYFHSPGGDGSAAILVGRMLRQRNMAAGVARTRRAGCDDATRWLQMQSVFALGDPRDRCAKLSQSVDEPLSVLQSAGAGCLSACVFALIGATSRSVGPGAAIGVHKPGQYVGRGEERFLSEHVPPIKLSARLREIARYIHEMGLDEGLYDAIYATPFFGMRYLTRDEIVRFRVDSGAVPAAP